MEVRKTYLTFATDFRLKNGNRLKKNLAPQGVDR